MTVFEKVVMGFDIDNTLLLVKCSKEDMLEGMMLLPVGVSLLLKKCDKEDMLEGIVSLLLMNRGNVMANNKVMAPVGTSMTYRKA